MSDTGETFVLGHKQTIVGSFYERLAHNVFGGNLTQDTNGDVCLWRSETSIEVKASGFRSPYGFRLSVDQIEKYARLNGFPFRRIWYALFSYENRRQTRDGKRQTELAAHSEEVAVQRFLAEHTLWCLLVDFSVVKDWRETRPLSKKSILGHLGMETIDLPCKTFAPIFGEHPIAGFRVLNFAPSILGTLSGKATVAMELDLFTTQEVQFPVMMVLPHEEISQVQRNLRRRGFRLRRNAIL